MPTNGDSASPSAVTGRSGGFCELAPFPEVFFGAVMRFPALSGAREAVAALEDAPETLGAAVCEHGGLLHLPEMDDISDEPELLLRLSKLLGPEVEDYRNSYTFVNRRNLFDFHDTVPEIIQITNMPHWSRRRRAPSVRRHRGAAIHPDFAATVEIERVIYAIDESDRHGWWVRLPTAWRQPCIARLRDR